MHTLILRRLSALAGLAALLFVFFPTTASAQEVYVATLSSGTEIPPSYSAATGVLELTLDGREATVTGSFSGLESDFATNIGAHIHLGFPGSTGPVKVPLEVTLSDDLRSGTFSGTYGFNDNLQDALRQRRLYVNVHSVDNAPGEIRGQLLPQADMYFQANLAGYNEVGPNNSNARGGVTAELRGNELTVFGGFNNLTGRVDFDIAGGAHLHTGGPSENGPIAIGLAVNVNESDQGLSGGFLASENVYTLTDEQLESLTSGNLYVNIHTTMFPPGELRGQLLMSPNAAPAMTSITAPADGAEITLAGPSNTPFQPSWDSTVDSNEDAIVYLWQLSTDRAFGRFATVVYANVGSATQFDATFGAVDTLLANAGVPEGGSITLYHRVLASDGSVAHPGPGAAVTLTRGEITDAIEMNMARAQVIHNAADPAAASVDVYVNGALALDDLAFRTASPFVDLPAEEAIEIAVAPPTSTSADDALATFEFTLETGESYTIVANGVLDPTQFAANPDGEDTGFNLFVSEGSLEASENEGFVAIQVFHGASDAPAVDITAIGQVLVDNVTYGSFTEGYLELPPISATLNVTPAEDNDTIVASFAGDLTMLGGQAITALASGFLDPAANQDGAAFDILIVLADGTALTLPVVTDTEDAADVPNGFSLLGNYPNPFNPTTTIAFDLPSAADVTVDVYNATGQQVMTMSPGFLAAGTNQSVTLNALDLPSGLYLYRVTATTQVDTFSQTGRMLLLK